MCSRRSLRFSHRSSRAASTPWVASAAPRAVCVLAVASCVLAMIPAGATAQDLGALSGTVTAADAQPIARAQVRVVGADGMVLTGIDGGFRLPRLPVGPHVLEVRMLGYARAELAFEVAAGVTSSVQVTLALEPAALRAVEVTAELGRTPGLRSFYDRRARGAGHFFTRDEIARLHPRVVTDVLRRVPGVQIQSAAGPYETSSHVRMGRAAGGLGSRPCPVLFYVNGAPFPLTADLAINHYVAADDIEAIEVYTGASRIPPQFASNMHNSRCGVIAIWTRIGPDDSQSPDDSSKSDSSTRSRH